MKHYSYKTVTRPLFNGLLMLAITLILGLTCWSNPAKAGTKVSPESISLNTWYVSDFTAETGADYFTFKTSSRKNSRYLIITQILETPKECEAPVIAAELPEEEDYTGNVKNEYLKLATDQSVKVRFTGWDNGDWGDDPFDNLVDCDNDYAMKETSRIKFQFIILEVRSSSTNGEPINGSYSKGKASKIDLNTWYTGSFGVSIDKGYDELYQYLKFKTSSRKNSQYLVISRALTKDSDVFFDCCGKYYLRGLSYNFSNLTTDQCNRGISKLPANTTVKISVTSEWTLNWTDYVDPDEDGIPNFDEAYKYSIMVREVPALPSRCKITSLTKGSKRFTVKFAERGKTTRYKIAYKQSNAKTWKYVTTTNTSKTIKDLSKGKTYKVMVRAQRKIDGKYHSGQWSPIKTVKVS